MSSERIYSKTPNGADYSEIFYLNEKKENVAKEIATNVVIRECLNDGTLIKETFAKLKK